MGYARIISGGTDGRYSIELDYGSESKTAHIAALTTLLARIDTAIATQLLLIADADAKEAAQVVKVQAAQADVIAKANSLPPGSPRPDTQGFKFELQMLTQMQKRHAPLRLKLDALKFDRAQTLRRVAFWNTFNPTETRSAWCTDFTEDGAAGAYVSTIDIPGESNTIVLAPSCRPWIPSDGILTAREIMSPAQAFLNAAILPGWQKWKPTYRWGTCTAIDEDADTMSVSLASQPSSAQSLGINQTSTLAGVPVVYMTCNAAAFEVGDRVVVQFIGQDWENPRVIGFLDNPKSCRGWALMSITDEFFGIASPVPYVRRWRFRCTDAALAAQAAAAGTAGDLDYDYRIDRGLWESGFFVPATTIPRLDLDGKFAGTYIVSEELGQTYFTVLIFATTELSPESIYASYSLGSVVEFRVRLDGEVLLNVAIQNASAPTYLARTRSSILASNGGRLTYDLFLDTGT